MGRSYSDGIRRDAQGVEIEDGQNMDDDTGKGDFCQVSLTLTSNGTSLSNMSRSSSCFTRAAYQISETEAHMKKSEIKQGVFKVITVAVKFHGHAFGERCNIGDRRPIADDCTVVDRRSDPDHAESYIL